MISDFGHPRTRGGGGVKKGQIFADVLYGWPLSVASKNEIIINKNGVKLKRNCITHNLHLFILCLNRIITTKMGSTIIHQFV